MAKKTTVAIVAPFVEAALPESEIFVLAKTAGSNSLALASYLLAHDYAIPAKGEANPLKEEARLGFRAGFLQTHGHEIVTLKKIAIVDGFTVATALTCDSPAKTYGKGTNEYRAASYGQQLVRSAFESFWNLGLKAAGLKEAAPKAAPKAKPTDDTAVADTAEAEASEAAPSGRSDEDQLETLLGKLQDLAERQTSGQAWVQRLMPTIVTGLNAATQNGDANSSKLAAFITKTFL